MENKTILNAIKLFCVAFACTSSFHVADAFAQPSCVALFSSHIEKDEGPAFLLRWNPNLHNSPPVQTAVQQIKNSTGTSITKPADKIAVWLKNLESASPEYREQIKQHYLEQNLTKPNDVTHAFFDLQLRIMREQGRGNHEFTQNEKTELLRMNLRDQKLSLERWLDLFFTENTQYYPMWAKYWSINSIVNLGKFDPGSGRFSSRSKGQVTPFPDLNIEAFAMVIDAMTKKINGQSLDQVTDIELLKQLEARSFEKLYGRALQLVSEKSISASIKGKWVVYKQGSNHRLLVKSLAGMCTNWCTAGEETARTHLKDGDFHVFYSLDDAGLSRIPRIAIRMDGKSIGEIRGVATDQNLDPAIAGSSVLNDKLKEFGPEGKAYYKKLEDMKRLTRIEQLVQTQEIISDGDLRFLYEIDDRIQGYGQKRDTRIDEIKDKRDQKADIAKITGVLPAQISTTVEEAITGKFKHHIGSLDLSGINNKKIKGLPEFIHGDFKMSGASLPAGFIFPKTIKGNFDIMYVEKAVDAKFPEYVQENVLMHLLSEAGDYVVFPKYVGGGFIANNLSTVNVVIYPEYIGKSASVVVSQAKKLVLPKHIGESIRLNNLRLINELIWPEFIGGNLFLPIEKRGTVPDHLKSALQN